MDPSWSAVFPVIAYNMWKYYNCTTCLAHAWDGLVRYHQMLARQSHIITKMAPHLDSICALVETPRTFGAGGPNQNTCACGLVPGVPTKTRLESRVCTKEVCNPI